MVIEPLRERIDAVVASVAPADSSVASRAESRQQTLTKPPGSLGRLESIATRVCAIQRTMTPRAEKRLIIVCAGDHGVAREGVSAYPQAVTAQMVRNFLAGGAAINALARVNGVGLWVIDVGVAADVPNGGSAARLISRRVRDGTRNMVEEAAMSPAEMLQAMSVGIDAAAEAAADGVDAIGLGDMGIANTTAASAISAALLGVPPAAVTGSGTGVNQATLRKKIAAIERALSRHRLEAGAPLDVLAAVGGLEIAALAGVCLGAAASRRIVVLDGFITTAAALVAVSVCPNAADYMFASHLSPEPGHAIQLAHLRQRALLDLEMRLGEGTGAALAMNVIVAGCAAFNEMATFEQAGVSDASC